MKTPLLLIAALPLAGCISFGAKPPPTLLTLTSQSQVAVGQDQNSATAKSITIQVPTVPQSLATARVPVQASPTSIAYVKDAQWAEPPARLFARLVSDTVAARTGMVVLSTIQSVNDPSAQLAGELRNFGLDATTREAVVTFDAALTRAGKTTVEKRRFEARVPVAAIDATGSAAGINQAANTVATEVADWVGAEPPRDVLRSLRLTTVESSMPQGDKSAYTDKQKRKAAHIEQAYEERGIPEKEAEARAWATVNKDSGGGNKSGSGRGKPDPHASARQSGTRSAAAKKGWETRRKNAAA